jgi:hypothetical protein
VLAEAVAAHPDPRTSEVLRSVQRARRMARADLPREADHPAALAQALSDLRDELRSLREQLAKAAPLHEEVAQRTASSARIVEHSLVVANDRWFEAQRRHEVAVGEVRYSVDGQGLEVAALVAAQARWGRRIALAGVLLAVLFVGWSAVVWRAYSLARDTHSTLVQILEDHARAHARKGTRR